MGCISTPDKNAPSTISIKGVAHGVIDFVAGTFQGLHMAATHMGAGELSLKDKRRAFKAVQKMHDRQMALLETKVMEAFGVDPSDATYQSSRYYTRLGLEVYSIAAGGYGAVKGVMALRKLATMPAKIPKALKFVNQLYNSAPVKGTESIRKLASELTFTQKALSRMKSSDRFVPRHILSEAMEIGKKSADPYHPLNLTQVNQEITVNNKPYNLKIIYNELEKRIYHFHYER